MRRKITVVGAGMVGSQAAYWLALRELGDVVLIDIRGDMAKGKALDLAEALPIAGADVSVVGGSDYRLTKDSDVVIVVAGVPRKPGMTREKLLEINAEIVKDVTKSVVKHSPNAILVVVTNPLDAMAWVAKKVSGFPRERVVGMAGVLDSARFRLFIAQELGVSVGSVSALVMGSHGEAMVPMERFALANGIPAVELLGKKRMNKIVQRVKNAGAEIVELLKTGSAFYAPGAAIYEMVDAIVKDKKKVLPCSVYLNGEYGIKDCYVGVPVVLGKRGVEKIIEVKLNAQEKRQFGAAVKSIKGMIGEAKRFL